MTFPPANSDSTTYGSLAELVLRPDLPENKCPLAFRSMLSPELASTFCLFGDTGESVHVREARTHGRRFLTPPASLAPALESTLEPLLDSLEVPLASFLRDAIEETIALIAQEGVKNIRGHAYADREMGPCAVSVAVRSCRATAAPFSEIEAAWYRAIAAETRGFVELSLADAGDGIPSTLQEAYSMVPLPGPEEIADGGVLLWSFNHLSTRHTDRAGYAYNWRGLHRALQAAWRLRGLICLRSGRARVGYSLFEPIAEPFSTAVPLIRGTTLTIRIPLPGPAHVKEQRELLFSRVPSTLYTRSENEIPTRPMPSAFSWSLRPKDYGPAGEPGFLVIAEDFPSHPERELGHTTKCWDELRKSLVPVHLHRIAPSPQEEASALAIDSSISLEDAVPQLGVIYEPLALAEGPIGPRSYRLLARGRTTPRMQALLAALQNHGTADPRVAPDEAELLARHYPQLFRLVPNLLRVQMPAVREEILAAAFQAAFERWLARATHSSDASSWLFDQPVRLPSGTVARPFVATARLLHRYPIVERLLARRLLAALVTLQNQYPTAAVVADSPATTYLFNRLLQTAGTGESPIPSRSDFDLPMSTPAILLCDALFQGSTIRAIYERSRSALCAVLAAFDIPPDRKREALPPIPIQSVARLNSAKIQPETVQTRLVCDAVTHVPREKTEVHAISSIEACEQLLQRTQGLVRIGPHVVGGRFQTTSLSVHRLVERAAPALTDAIGKILLRTLSEAGVRLSVPIVFFHRGAEAEVSRLLEPLCQVMRRAGRCHSFSAPLALAHRGRATLFQDPALSLDIALHGLSSPMLFPAALPEVYAAVYLDDRFVTGKTLRHLGLSLSSTTPGPLVLISVFLESRASPLEDASIERLGGSLKSARGARRRLFFFEPIYRVPVVSYRRSDDWPLIAAMKALGESPVVSYLPSLERRTLSAFLSRLAGLGGSPSDTSDAPTQAGPEEMLADAVLSSDCSDPQSAHQVVLLRSRLADLEQNRPVFEEVQGLLHSLSLEAAVPLFRLLILEPRLVAPARLRALLEPRLLAWAHQLLDPSERRSDADRLTAVLLLSTLDDGSQFRRNAIEKALQNYEHLRPANQLLERARNVDAERRDRLKSLVARDGPRALDAVSPRSPEGKQVSTPQVQSREEAILRVVTFLREHWPHGNAFRIAVNRLLAAQDDAREPLAELGPLLRATVEDELLPTVDALACLLSADANLRWHLDQLIDNRVVLTHFAGLLRQFSANAGALLREDARQFAYDLRRQTYVDPLVGLYTQRLEAIPTSPLERAVPLCFSAPRLLLFHSNFARRYRGQPREREVPPYEVLLPIPTACLISVLEVILGNAASHGTGPTVVSYVAEAGAFCIRFETERQAGATQGLGRGFAELRDLMTTYDLSLTEDTPDQRGDYAITARFQHHFELSRTPFLQTGLRDE